LEDRSCETDPIALERMEGQVLGEKGVMMSRTRKEPWQNKANLPGRGLGDAEAGPPAFHRLAVQTKPICPATAPEAGDRQARSNTKPISGPGSILGDNLNGGTGKGGMGFQPMQHRQDADATEYTALGNSPAVPPRPPPDCDHRVDGIEPSQFPPVRPTRWARKPSSCAGHTLSRSAQERGHKGTSGGVKKRFNPARNTDRIGRIGRSRGKGFVERNP